MNIDYLNRVGTAHENFKTHEMRLNEENQNLKKEIERLNNIINEQDKDLELERKSRQLLTDDLANVCEMSLKKDNIINKAIEYIKINGNWWTDEIEGCQDLIKILKGEEDGIE